MDPKSLHKINDFLWEIPRHGEMKVPGRIFASEKLIQEMDEKVREQVTNVAMLPGIQVASIAMPDAHWGYGFPIGGVAAFDPDEGGIISMGGVGFDISCGVRTMKTGMSRDEVMPRLKTLVDQFFNRVPAGVGSEGLIKLSPGQIDEMLLGGAVWAIKKGFGIKEDLDYIEEQGRVSGAEPEHVSDTAKKRQYREMGTLGCGNHYLEVQVVSEVYDEHGRPGHGITEGRCRHHGALRLARTGPPDRNGLFKEPCSCSAAVQPSHQGPGTRLGAHRVFGRQEVLRRHVRRHQLRTREPPDHHPSREGNIYGRLSRRAYQDALRHQPQHLQSGDAHDRRQEKKSVCSSQRSYPGLRSGPDRSSAGVPAYRPARTDRRDHGYIVLYPRRNRGGDEDRLRLGLPRRRAGPCRELRQNEHGRDGTSSDYSKRRAL